MNQNANEFPSYEDYLNLCKTHNVEEEHIMSKKEYEDDFVEIAKEVRNTGITFIPSLPGGRTTGIKVNNALNTFASAIGLASTIVGRADDIRYGIATASVSAKNVYEEISRITGGTIKVAPFSNDGGQGPRGPGGSGGGGTKANPFDIQRLNYNTKPVEIRWNTNIKPNTYSPFFLEGTVTSAPLHISCARFQFSKNDVKINRFMDTFITLAYQTALQKAVSFSINTRVLTSENIINSLNAIASSLQVYYWLASVISYADGPHNKNEGMLHLRNLISTDELNDIYILQRILINIPIPPRLMELMFYLNQNYSSSSLPGSAMIKICPVNFIQVPIGKDAVLNRWIPKDVVSDCIDLLSSTTNREIFSIFARACPSWVNNSLFSSPSNPVHDPQFTTLFANLPFQYTCGKTGANYTGPTIYDQTNIQKQIVSSYYLYNSYVDILDGGIFGLFTGWDHAQINWLPGLMMPACEHVSTLKLTFTRFSYFSDLDGRAADLYAVYDLGRVGSSRGETYVSGLEIDCDARGAQRFGTEVCLGVTSETVRESAFALIEWLLCIDDIGKNSSGTSNFKGPRKGKSKGSFKNKGRKKE